MSSQTFTKKRSICAHIFTGFSEGRWLSLRAEAGLKPSSSVQWMMEDGPFGVKRIRGPFFTDHAKVPSGKVASAKWNQRHTTGCKLEAFFLAKQMLFIFRYPSLGSTSLHVLVCLMSADEIYAASGTGPQRWTWITCQDQRLVPMCRSQPQFCWHLQCHAIAEPAPSRQVWCKNHTGTALPA